MIKKKNKTVLDTQVNFPTLAVSICFAGRQGWLQIKEIAKKKKKRKEKKERKKEIAQLKCSTVVFCDPVPSSIYKSLLDRVW